MFVLCVTSCILFSGGFLRCVCISDMLVFSVTVIEVLPKEKKQKEEKTVLLGQCTVDMLPLVKGMLPRK